MRHGERATAEEADAFSYHCSIVGASPAMLRLTDAIRAVAPYACTVLINGESGSGKELVAQAIHAASPRSHRPFVPVDCTTLRDTLLESQLFGHVKGAFTGADRDNLGFIRAADGGTLLLDEVGELPLPAQAKLLRVIQERVVVPVGGTRPVPVDVRILAATHRDLEKMVKEGTFREDLYFRLRVVRLLSPPLRERREDIPALARHLLEKLCALYGRPARTIEPAAMDALSRYDWPGNVRELANAIERAFIFSPPGDSVVASALPDEIQAVAALRRNTPEPERVSRNIAPLVAARVTEASAEDTLPTWDEMERSLITKALRRTSGKIAPAARLLNIERRRLTRKIDEFGLRELCTAE